MGINNSQDVSGHKCNHRKTDSVSLYFTLTELRTLICVHKQVRLSVCKIACCCFLTLVCCLFLLSSGPLFTCVVSSPASPCCFWVVVYYWFRCLWGKNDGGCRGLDLFWGYLDDAYFLAWATLESSLEIFDLHKSRYKGNHRKIASGHFLLSDYFLIFV